MKHAMLALALAATTAGTAAIAQDVEKQIKARQGQFQIIAMNLGVLGEMAKGAVAYDADAAQRAANSLVGVSMIDPTLLWVDGSDSMSVDGTRALPAIWDNNAQFLERWNAYVAGAEAMAAAAGGGQEALGPAMGQIGGTCKACHDDFRAPQ